MNYKEIFSLKNKISLVVGSNGLLGSAVCDALLQHDSTVIGIDIKNNFKENNFFYFNSDFSNEKNITKCLKKVFKKFGCPDVFVNCSYPRSKNWSDLNFLNAKYEILKKNIDMHLNSYIWSSRIVAEKMKKKKKKGSIVLFGSMYGVVGQNLEVYKGTEMTENFAYAAIKGGIVNYTRELASCYGKYSIRSNVICPGGIEGHVAGVSSKQPIKFLNNYKKIVPMKRLGKPNEVAAPVLFLSSDASSYINGSVFMVDGGWTAI